MVSIKAISRKLNSLGVNSLTVFFIVRSNVFLFCFFSLMLSITLFKPQKYVFEAGSCSTYLAVNSVAAAQRSRNSDIRDRSSAEYQTELTGSPLAGH